MARLTFTFTSQRGWAGGLLSLVAAGTVLGLVAALALLPGLSCGDTLTAAQAERSIRAHLETQAILRFQNRLSAAPARERARLNAALRRERRALTDLEIVAIDVDTVVFGYTKIRRSFVVEVVARGADQELSTRYYCFLSGHLTGECGRWNGSLAF